MHKFDINFQSNPKCYEEREFLEKDIEENPDENDEDLIL
jgi:hypothetical protein